MRKTSTLALALLLAGMAAPAAEFEGHLMDAMCAATRLNQAAGHTLRCIKNCSKSGFGLVTKEGQYVRFNEAGNVRALRELKETAKQDNLLVKVSGEMKDGVIQVDKLTIE